MKAYIGLSTLASIVTLLPMNGALIGRTQQASQPPAVVQAVAPSYPRIAATAGASGTVIVEAKIDTRGAVTSVNTVGRITVLAKAAENSAKRWIFAADESSNARVVRLTFVFKIMPRATPGDELLPIFMPPYSIEVRTTVPEGIDSVNRDPPMTRKKKH
jgi:TonB family protein